jgi:hypothetical protein
LTTNSDPGPRPVISRYLIIILALGATMLQVSRGAWIQATGLAALALGLVIIQFLAPRRPALKPLAWLAFGVTAATMVIVWMRMRA